MKHPPLSEYIHFISIKLFLLDIEVKWSNIILSPFGLHQNYMEIFPSSKFYAKKLNSKI